MSTNPPNIRQGDCVLLSNSRCMKPCCEAEIKLKIISRAIRRKSSIEQLTHLLDCLVETKNGHGEMLPSGYHGRVEDYLGEFRDLSQLWLARDEGKMGESVNSQKKLEVKREPKKEAKTGNNAANQLAWTLPTIPSLEFPNVQLPSPLSNISQHPGLAAQGLPKMNGHREKNVSNGEAKKVAAQRTAAAEPVKSGPVKSGPVKIGPVKSGPTKKRVAANESKKSRPRKKPRLERGSEESKSNKIKRPSVFVFCQHCKKIRHLAPRSDKKGSKDIFRHECRDLTGLAVRVSQNLLTRSRNCKVEHENGCIRLATSKEISDLQQKKRTYSTNNGIAPKRERDLKNELGTVPNELGTVPVPCIKDNAIKLVNSF